MSGSYFYGGVAVGCMCNALAQYYVFDHPTGVGLWLGCGIIAALMRVAKRGQQTT